MLQADRQFFDSGLAPVTVPVAVPVTAPVAAPVRAAAA